MLEFEKVIRQLHSSVSLLEGEGHVAYIVFMLGFRKEISIIRKQLMEKEMATHSSVLAWRIPGMAEPGGLPSVGSHRVGHD